MCGAHSAWCAFNGCSGYSRLTHRRETWFYFIQCRTTNKNNYFFLKKNFDKKKKHLTSHHYVVVILILLFSTVYHLDNRLHDNSHSYQRFINWVFRETKQTIFFHFLLTKQTIEKPNNHCFQQVHNKQYLLLSCEHTRHNLPTLAHRCGREFPTISQCQLKNPNVVVSRISLHFHF